MSQVHPSGHTLKKFVRGVPGREGVQMRCTYDAIYDQKGVLVTLHNNMTSQTIPSHTQTFRRLADNNRGNKFKAA